MFMKKSKYLIFIFSVILIVWRMHFFHDSFFAFIDYKFYDYALNYKANNIDLNLRAFNSPEKYISFKKIFVIEIDDDGYNSILKSIPGNHTLSAKRRIAFAKVIDELVKHQPKFISFDFTFEHGTEDFADEILLNSIRNAEKKGVSVIFSTKLDFLIDYNLNKTITVPKPLYEKFSEVKSGFINQSHVDGVIRYPILFIELDGNNFESLAFKSYKAFTGEQNFELKENMLITDTRKIPLKKQYNGGSYSYMFNYMFLYDYEQLSIMPLSVFVDDSIEGHYKSMLEAEIETEGFKNSAIFVGTSAAEDQDFVYYPLSQYRGGVVPGVFIHAASFSGLINNDFYTEMSQKNTFIMMIAIILVLFVIFYFLGPFKSVFVLIFFMIFYTFLSFGCFYYKFYKIPFFIVQISIALTFTASQVWKYFYESNEKRFIKNAFEKYLSPKLVGQISESPALLKLGGEEKELSILFSDIANFTTMSEKMSPVELVSFLNEYLTAMTDIVMDKSGTLDKYIGDAVMAFWGAPLADENHSSNACSAAINMIKKLKELKISWKEKGLPDLNIRIGIATGPAVVGNMGSAKRFNYTVMGDTVNLSARLEGLNKEYGTSIMVSENVYINNKDKFNWRELDYVKVKGKELPIRVYQLIDFEIDEMYNKGLQIYYKALELYRAGDFENALNEYKKVDEFIKNDKCCNTFMERCKYFIQNPPEAWDGIWTMKTK